MTNVIFYCAQVNALIIQWILTGFQVSSVTKKQYRYQSYKQLLKKTITVVLQNKSEILPDLRPKRTEIEEPSITDEIDMVVDENIPMVEIEVAELNRIKEETESY